MSIAGTAAYAIQDPQFTGATKLDDKSTDYCYGTTMQGSSTTEAQIRNAIGLASAYMGNNTDLVDLGVETCNSSTDIRGEWVSNDGEGWKAEWVCVSRVSGNTARCNRGVIKFAKVATRPSAEWNAIGCHETMHAIGFDHYKSGETNLNRGATQKSCLLTPDIVTVSTAEKGLINGYY